MADFNKVSLEQMINSSDLTIKRCGNSIKRQLQKREEEFYQRRSKDNEFAIIYEGEDVCQWLQDEKIV